MKLMVHELKTTLQQKLKTPSYPISLYAIRPHLYLHNAPLGALEVRILDADQNLMFQSSPVEIDAVTVSNPYFHGYIRFNLRGALKANTFFYAQLLASSDYEFSNESFIGWCNDYDLRKYTAAYTPNEGFRAALDLEVWHYAQVNRGSL